MEEYFEIKLSIMIVGAALTALIIIASIIHEIACSIHDIHMRRKINNMIDKED